MNHSQVLALLKANQNEKNIELWNQRNSSKGELKSFGIGLTILRKLAKQIGKNHALALELWESDIYDVRVIALLIDDPKHITREQVEIQVEKLKQGHLAHVFSSCGASLAKTPFVIPLLVDWINSKDPMRRSCGYGLLYEVSKSKKKSAPSEAFFLERIEDMKNVFSQEKGHVLLSIGGALLGIGKRTAKLNASALQLARQIGPIQVVSNGKKCEPFDVMKHLTSDYIKAKLGLS